MKSNLKNTKYQTQNTQCGITLVALIITVIILLILATVSIKLIMNEGIIGKAEKGTASYSSEEELEQIKLAVASAKLAGNGFLTAENLNTELQKVFNHTETVNENSNYYEYKTYKIYKDGTVEKMEPMISRLPTEYQEIEYIESTGTQFINTEVYPKSTTKVFFDFSLTENIGQNGWGSSESNEAFIWGIYRNSYFYSVITESWIADSGRITNVNCDYNRHKFFLYSGHQAFDEIKYGDTIIGDTATNKQYMYLFALHQEWENRQGNYSKGAGSYCKERVFLCQIYDNITMVRNYIPCYSTTTVTDANGVQKPANTKGLYDTVEGKFYTNQGSGDDFIAGPNV